MSRIVRTRLLIPSLATVFLAAVACGGSSGGDSGGTPTTSASAASVTCASLLTDKDWPSKVSNCEDSGNKQVTTVVDCRDKTSKFITVGMYGWGRTTGALQAGPQSGPVYTAAFNACILGS
jgi:hypothetical protein